MTHLVARISLVVVLLLGVTIGIPQLSTIAGNPARKAVSQSVCPKCNGQMEFGYTIVTDHNIRETTIVPIEWRTTIPAPKYQNAASPIVSHRCKKCGFIELYAK